MNKMQRLSTFLLEKIQKDKHLSQDIFIAIDPSTRFIGITVYDPAQKETINKLSFMQIELKEKYHILKLKELSYAMQTYFWSMNPNGRVHIIIENPVVFRNVKWSIQIAKYVWAIEYDLVWRFGNTGWSLTELNVMDVKNSAKRELISAQKFIVWKIGKDEIIKAFHVAMDGEEYCLSKTKGWFVTEIKEVTEHIADSFFILLWGLLCLTWLKVQSKHTK